MSDFLDRISKLPADRLALLAAELKTRLDRAERTVAARNEPIAIVGIGCRFPGGAEDPDGYWRLLRGGVDAVREVPAERWDLKRLYDPDPDAPGTIATKVGGFLERVDGFDARFFGIAPREALSIDPQQRLLLEVAWEALENAGIAPDGLEGIAGGVFIGLCNHDYHELMLERPLESIDSYFASGTAGSMAAGRIAYLLGLMGPALTVDTACSSSLVAVHLACESLRNGESRIAISGGANLILGIETMIGLTKAHMISPDGRCRAFDEQANGIVRGEGCGIVVLKRLADARADGDRIHALIRATAINQDGRSSGITAPNGPAQEALMQLALRRAQLQPGDVDFVEAHGTGTRLGDPIEVRALGAVYGDRPADRPLRIGSVKTNFGHLEAAAGIAGLLKVVLSLRNREIPPHLHLTSRNPLIEWDRWALEVPTAPTPWVPSAEDGRRRGAVSSFGFSGTNAHMILEEAPVSEAPVPPDDRPLRVLTLSARSEAALGRLAERYADLLGRTAESGLRFADVCHTAAVGRAKLPHRLALVAESNQSAAESLRAWVQSGSAPAVVTGRSASFSEPVFLFSGQGSQQVGMGRDLFETCRTFRDAIDSCDALLRDHLETPLVDVLYPSDQQMEDAGRLIDRTAYTQPALFAVEYALAELWRSWGIEPAAVAGHSIGEFAAATVAGVLSLEDAIRLVALRGRLMQGLPAGGAMVAVMADAATVEEALRALPSVAVAGYNGPANTVISGPANDVTQVATALTGRGVQCKPLVVSHAFHSALMDPMLEELERAAASVRLNPPELPFFSTTTGEPVADREITEPRYWREQARRPVRFADAVRSLSQAGHALFLELGPHPTLSALGRATIDNPETVFLPSLRRDRSGREEMLRTASVLHVRGAGLNWPVILGQGIRRRVDLPTYPFERSSYWLGWSRRAHGAARDDDGRRERATQAQASQNLLWTREWIDPDQSSTAAFVADPGDLQRRLRPRVDRLIEEHGAEVYAHYLPRLDALCAAYIGKALRSLGASLQPGDRIEAEELRDTLGIRPAHSRLLHRMLAILGEDGVLQREGGSWRVTANPAAAQVDVDELANGILRDFPACRAESEVTVRCGSSLADVLIGAANPMELLFPGGSLDATERLYGTTPSFRVFNTLVAEAVRCADEHRPDDRTLRVLEIGAGTGGTTSCLLPLLSPSRTKYVFTDVSPIFLERARARFAGYDFVDYRLLDIGSDAAVDAVGQTFDVIVASNVLHATPDLRATLANVRRLLAPGGMLVLLEGTRPQRFGDLTVGMTEGWWSFRDESLRSGYALIDARSWLELLRGVGFEEVTVLPEPRPEDPGILGQQSVLLARAPTARPDASGVAETSADTRRWSAVCNSGGRSGRLVAQLRAEGIEVDTAGTTEAAHAAVRAGAVAGVLHLLSLDEESIPSEDSELAMERQRRSTGSALELTRALARGGVRTNLVLVTRAAKTAGGVSVDPVGAPAWGLGRAATLEHPELRCVRVDLPPGDDPATARLLARVLTDDRLRAEDEIAIRGTSLMVPRIAPVRPRASARQIEFDPAGSYIITGGMRGLGLRIAGWMASRGAGHLVLAGRSAASAAARKEIAELQGTGCTVTDLCADVSRREGVAALISAAGSDRLRGIIHCAGITADAALIHQDWAHLRSVMEAKVAGAWNLHCATESLALDHFVLFSTAAAFLGSAGQANHAAANAFLSGLARHRRSRGLTGLAIDWGAWSEVGAATHGDILERARAAGLGSLDPETGLDILERLMLADETHVAAVAIDWEAFLGRNAGAASRGLFERVRANGARAQATTAEKAESRTGGLARTVMAALPRNRRAVLLDGLHADAARVLGLASGELIDADSPLTALGLDSLMAVELRNSIALDVDRTLPATLLFNYPTLAELTDFLAGELGVRAPIERLTGAADSDDALDALTEEEMAGFLERKLKTSGPVR